MFIYKTTNKLNGKFYIGQHTKNNDDYIGSGKILLWAIEKYGKENFVREVIEYCNDRKHLDSREKFWIKKLNPHYNITDGGTGGYNQAAVDANIKKRKGKKWEDIYSPSGLEIMKRVSKKSNPKPLLDKIKKDGPWNKGKTGYSMPPASDERKQKISLSNKGRVISNSAKEKTRETLSKQWEDKNSVWNTKEYREKLSNAQRERWEREKIPEEVFLEVYEKKISVSNKCSELGISTPTYYKYRDLYIRKEING